MNSVVISTGGVLDRDVLFFSDWAQALGFKRPQSRDSEEQKGLDIRNKKLLVFEETPKDF